ncbi:MAG: DUF1858 domain-containing protein [Candidatus Woesearchaeota archaeon]
MKIKKTKKDTIENKFKKNTVKKSVTPNIIKTMNIGEVVQKYPETVPIMLAHGLHCIGCHVSYYETIEQGCLAHGMLKNDIQKMIKKMNSLVNKLQKEPVKITETAAKKLKELAKGKDFGLRIRLSESNDNQYDLSLEHKPKSNETTIQVDGIKIFLDSTTLNFIRGSTVDFINDKEKKGFVILKSCIVPNGRKCL